MEMERHHFCFARDFTQTLPVFVPTNPVCVRISAAFLRNTLRLQSLGSLPILLVGATTVIQTFDVKARAQLNIQEDDPELTVGHARFNEARFREKEELRIKLNREWFEKVQRREVASGMDLGEVGIAALVPRGGDETKEGIDAILGGMLIGAWTAFETLASDLWVGALNAHPAKLATLVGRWHKKEKFESDEIEEDEDEELGKVVKLNDLAFNDYNLSDKMGRIHKYRFKWGVLEGIRRAYGSAFSTGHEDIKKAIENTSLDALSAVRNILVHKAGIVDEQFKRKHKAWPAFSIAIPGSPLVIDGIIVRDLLSASMGSAIELMRAVDIWLQTH